MKVLGLPGRTRRTKEPDLGYPQDWPESTKASMMGLHGMNRTDIIHGDRRLDRRYVHALELRFSYAVGGSTQFGSGVTYDLSRGAVRFHADNPPPDGVDVELRIAWPFLLQNVCPLELVVRGSVTTVAERGTILAMRHYEFRTCGQRSFAAAATSTGSSSILA